MLPREEKYIHDWEKNRGKEKWSYLLLTAFMWGTIVPFVYKFINVVTHYRFSLDLLLQTFLSLHFFFLWIKFVVGFFVFAFVMWHLSYKKYKELKRKQVSQEHFQEMGSDFQ
jgi:predicted membrane protein